MSPEEAKMTEDSLRRSKEIDAPGDLSGSPAGQTAAEQGTPANTTPSRADGSDALHDTDLEDVAGGGSGMQIFVRTTDLPETNP
jgi:hypothetical protein